MASLRLAFISLVAALVLALAPAAGAVVDGSVDTSHSEVVFVGQVVVTAAAGPINAGSCSGTLLSPTVVVTAAHCGLVDPRLEPLGVQQVFYVVIQGSNYRAPSGAQMGLLFAHPGFEHGGNGVPHFAKNDVAVVRLLTGPLAGPYAQLPSPALSLRPNTGVDVLGFGFHALHGDELLPRDGFRRIADGKILGNASVAGQFLHFKGGACEGDSGGPLLLGDVVVGVISFAPKTCRSTSYATDLRSPGIQSFVRSFLN